MVTLAKQLTPKASLLLCITSLLWVFVLKIKMVYILGIKHKDFIYIYEVITRVNLIRPASGSH